MLRVLIEDVPVGRLDRKGNGTTFVYDEGVPPEMAISLTMPVRTASYDTSYGLLPVFDTNLPEGTLRDKITRSLAKVNGKADAFDILSLTGSNQIGRLRVVADGTRPTRRNAVGNISELLQRPCTRDFMDEVMTKYGMTSGVSGVMPKVLVSEEGATEEGKRMTVLSRDFILKFEDNDYPGLALNEFHCMNVARIAGIKVPWAFLSDDARMLAVRRFDEVDGNRIGFEDFASLNGKVSDEKYDGSIETSLFKRIAEFSDLRTRSDNLRAAFEITVLNCALRNGDAHLKNFALLFNDAANGLVEMSPAYDIVSTKVYIANDMMAMTYNGSKRWPDRKGLIALAARAKIAPKDAAEIIDRIGATIVSQMPYMRSDFEHYGRDEIGAKMQEVWEEGMEKSLGYDFRKAVMDLEDAAAISEEETPHP